MERLVNVRITLPLPDSSGDTYSYEEEMTLEDLAEEIRILSKPSMFGPLGFTVEILPK